MSNGIKNLLRVALSAALLALLLKFVPLDKILASLRSVDLRWLAVGICWSFVERVFSAQRMKFISGQVGMTHGSLELLRINLMTSFSGLFLPGHLAGGAVRWRLMAHRDKKHEAALAAMVFDRLNDLSILVSLTCVAIVFLPGFGLDSELRWLVITALLLLPVVYAIIFSRTTGKLANGLLTRMEPSLPNFMCRIAHKLLDAVAQFYGTPWSFKLRGWSLSVASHVSGSIAFVFFAMAVGLPVTWPELFVARAILAIAMLLPITVAGLGVREGLLLIFFKRAAESSVIIAFSGMVFAGLLALSLVGGILVVAALWKSSSVEKAKPA